jgi:GT2 family glycosyltransferase
MVQPSAVLYHRVSATLSKWKRSERRFISERNTFRTLLKNYSLLSLLKILPRYFGLIIAEVSFFAIRKPEMTISYFRAIFWNMRNLKDTWLRRQKIQSIRTISDNTIMSYMLDQPTKLLILKEFMASYSTGTLRKYLGEQP